MEGATAHDVALVHDSNKTAFQIMDEIKEILQCILSTELLGATLTDVAGSLGYKGRMSVYRVKNGLGSAAAVRELAGRIDECLNIGEEELWQMGVTVANAERFGAMMRKEMVREHPDRLFQSLIPFVWEVYDHFSPEFRGVELPGLMKLRADDPEAFYCMLAWYYVKNCGVDFYARGLTYRERCGRVLGKLGARLAEVDGENAVGRKLAEGWRTDFVYGIEKPILWNCVKHVAVLLRSYGDPGMMRELFGSFVLIKGLEKRSYWRGRRTDEVAVMIADGGARPESGCYVLVRIDVATGEAEAVRRMCVYDEKWLTVQNVASGVSVLGMYEFTGDMLTFEWEHADDDPTGFGNRWERIDADSMTVVHRFDRSLTDERVRELCLADEGWEDVEGCEVVDIVVSRSDVMLVFKDGGGARISRSEAEGLRRVAPDAKAYVVRRLADGREFVCWGEYGLMIEFERFTRLASVDGRW